jgi:4-hydroxy-tetrahydrodipicolinate synthase
MLPSGIITALVTPFKDGELDRGAFEKLVDWQINEGVHGLVINGSTGESPNIEEEELQDMVGIAVNIANKRAPIIIGTGSSSTKKTVKLTQIAQKGGANAAMVVVPYYNKPTQAGLYEHYKAIHDASDLPIIIYNVPSRVIVDLKSDTFEKLASLPRIAGIKECGGSISRPVALGRIIDGLGKKNFSIFTGNDLDALAFGASGGTGCISVTANVAPKTLAQMQELMLAGNFTAALKIHKKMLVLHEAMFCETNPIPVKYALRLMGKLSDEVRLPLVGLSDASKKQVEAAMKAIELI